MIEALLVDAARAAARAVAPAAGRASADAIDALAVDALRAAFATAPVALHVVAGEGEKDEAPMLAPGEVLGAGGPAYDLVVDPVDGTRLAAAGRPGAMCVLAAAPRGAVAGLGAAFYADKLVARRPGLGLRMPVPALLAELAAAEGKPLDALRVAVQRRPRNAALAAELERAGALVVPFEHGDIEQSVRVLRGELDLLLGIGGAPEAVIEAGIARALGGDFQTVPAPQGDVEAARLGAEGVPFGAAAPVRDAAGIWAATPSVVIASITGLGLGAGLDLAPVGRDGSVEAWVARP